MSDRSFRKRPRTITYEPMAVVTKKKSSKSLQSTVLRTLRSNLEQKYLPVSAASAAVAASGSIYSLNAITEGDDYSNRQGREVYLTSVDIDYFIKGPTTLATADAGQVMLIYDSRPNGVTPAASDLWSLTSPQGGSYLNQQVFPDRFHILYHGNYSFTSQNGVVQNALGTRVRRRVKIPAKFSKCGFYATGSTVPSVGLLILCVISDITTGVSTTGPSFQYNCVVNFTDV
jgi:hypothetical protein